MVVLPPSFVPPPTDGSIPPALAIDFHYEHNPQHTFAVLYHTADSSQTKFTYEQLAYAVHRTAYILNPNNAIPQGTNIGILVSVSTLEYIVMVLGAMRAGLVPFPISPRVNPAGIAHLLTTTQTSLVLSGGSEAIDNTTAQLSTILDESNFSVKFVRTSVLGDIVSLADRDTTTDQFKPFPSLRPMNHNSTISVLHSSGSTGMPKAIKYHLEGVFKNIINQPVVWTFSGVDVLVGTMGLPTFHCMGLNLQVLASLYVGFTQVLFAPARVPVMPNPILTLSAIEHTRCSFIICVPAFLEAWAHDEHALAILKPMKGVIFGGGPLTDVIGNKLAKDGLRIYSGYGATEFGFVSLAPPHDTTDWPWGHLKFSPHLKAHFIPQNDQENTFELVFEAGEDHNPFVLNSELNGKAVYRTKDLLTPHPSKPNFWKFVGRVDDRIVLLNGEKANPGPMGAFRLNLKRFNYSHKTIPARVEAEIVKCPLVSSAVMFGQARDQTGVLIELKETPSSLSEIQEDRKNLIGKLWPFIERANQASATHSRLDKRAIIFVDPARPLPRTPKGTISRSAVLKLYTSDIEEMYTSLEQDLDKDAPDDVQPPKTWTDPNVVETWISERVKGFLGRDIDTRADLFQQGMDSLTATMLLRSLRATLHISKDSKVQACAQTLNQTVVFDHPTVKQLAFFLVQHINDPCVPNDHTLAALERIQATIRKYDSNWSRQVIGDETRRPGQLAEHIVVTGTTGGLGSHLLAQLLASDKVERVWALNRKSNEDTRDRQRVSFEDKLLDTGLLASEKLVFVDTALEDTRLGLGSELYDEIRNTATIIIHNAWQVNFNLALQSFEPNIRGTRNLINLAFSSTAFTGLPRFAFASSVSVAGFSGMGECLNEISVRPEDAVSTTGYGQSKLVAEKASKIVLWLLESARQAGLQTCIVRIGQLTGDIKSGSWDATNWVPSIIASSLSVGCLPAAVGTVSWLPLDVAARSIVDTCTTCEAEIPSVIHASHPRPVPWIEIMTAFSASLSSHTGSTLPLVEFTEWNRRVTENAATFEGSDVDRYKRFPSTKIQSTVDGIAHADRVLRSLVDHEGAESAGIVRLVTTRAEQMSEALRNTLKLGGEHVDKWVQYWNDKGIFV